MGKLMNKIYIVSTITPLRDKIIINSKEINLFTLIIQYLLYIQYNFLFIDTITIPNQPVVLYK